MPEDKPESSCDTKPSTTIIMQAKVKNTADQMCAAIGPIMYQVKDARIIAQAAGVLMARMAMGCAIGIEPARVLEVIHNISEQALEQLTTLENEEKRKKGILEQGVAGFDQFAQPAIEPGSAGDYPSNPNQNVLPFKKPFIPEDTTDEAIQGPQEEVTAVNIGLPQAAVEPTIDAGASEEAAPKQDP
jgi:hypothetical protein